MTMFITSTATSIRLRRGSGSMPASDGNGKGSTPSQYGSVRKVGPRAQQVVQMGRPGAGEARDDDGRLQFDVVDLGVPGQQVGEQQPVLQHLQQLAVEVDDARRRCRPSIVADVGQVDRRAAPGSRRRRSRRARCRRSALACSASASSGQSGASDAIMSRICSASGLNRGSARSSRWTRAAVASVTSTYVTLSSVMTTDFGRPRDPRIVGAVLEATVDAARRDGLRRALGRRDRQAGGHQQAGDLPALAQQGAPRPRGGLPARRGHRTPRHRIARRRRARDGPAQRRRADHARGRGPR